MTGDSVLGGNHYADQQQSELQSLKLTLHRHVVDSLDEDNAHLLEAPRATVALFVAERVTDYIKKNQLAVSRYETERLAEELVDELIGYGPLEVLLRDSSVTEILVNGPNRIFVEREGKLHRSELRFIDNTHVQRVIQRILASQGRRLDESSPMVDTRLPDGSRVNAIIPPIALDGPCVSIRKFRKDLMQSGDLIASKSFDDDMLKLLRVAVRERCNILVSGGTGTGKTTMLNIMSQLINPAERIVTIEDTAELQLNHSHVVRLETRPPNAEGHGEIAASGLIRNALRMRPDRIILGEIRGVEVIDVLQAMNTGHDGSMSTVHANNAQDSLLRLETLVGLTGQQVAEQTLRQMICAALDLVIQLVRLPNGRRCISEIVEVVGLRDGSYVTNTLFRYDRIQGLFKREAINPAGDKLREVWEELR